MVNLQEGTQAGFSESVTESKYISPFSGHSTAQTFVDDRIVLAVPVVNLQEGTQAGFSESVTESKYISPLSGHSTAQTFVMIELF